MLTNNWYNYLRANFLSAYQDRTFTGIEVTSTNGTKYAPAGSSNYCYYMMLRGGSLTSVASSNGGAGVNFGDGTVPPAKEDHCLSGNFISGLSLGSYSASHAVEGDTASVVITLTVKNGGAEPVTISEIAWVDRQYVNGGNMKSFMFDRTLLESPVTIPAGGQGVVVYKFSSTFPA